MINNNYNTISNSNNKNNKMCCVELKKHPMHMLANFVAFAPTVGIVDYIDTYLTKNIEPSLKNEAKENKRNGILETMFDNIQNCKKNKPFKYYTLLTLATLVFSLNLYKDNPIKMSVKNDENKEKSIKEKLTQNTIIGSTIYGATYGVTTSILLNMADESIKKKDYKGKNALKGLGVGAAVATFVGGLTLLSNKLTLEKFKKEQKQENNG